MKDLEYVKIRNVNPLYLIMNKINRNTEESNESKYLSDASLIIAV